jgi:hypothetical protein
MYHLGAGPLFGRVKGSSQFTSRIDDREASGDVRLQNTTNTHNVAAASVVCLRSSVRFEWNIQNQISLFQKSGLETQAFSLGSWNSRCRWDMTRTALSAQAARFNSTKISERHGLRAGIAYASPSDIRNHAIRQITILKGVRDCNGLRRRKVTQEER